MQYSDFRPLVCQSAEQYLCYLKEKQSRGYRDSGRNVISVNQVEPGPVPGEYLLYSSERVIHPEASEIWVMDQRIADVEILTTKTINRQTYCIRIADNGGYFKNYSTLNPGNIHIVSDLLFLIRRLLLFYKSNWFSLTPPSPDKVPSLPKDLTKDLSQEQLDAVDAVFQSPVSYISGAPGTGKTKAVLARCILRYALANKRIFLLAPTNNAVEQMLRGVLPILKDAGIDLSKVYRLGTATEGFARDYPQVVGDTEAEALLRSLLEQKARHETQISEWRILNEEAEKLSKRIDICTAIHTHITDLAHQVTENRTKADRLADEVAELTVQLNETKSTYTEAQKAASSAADIVASCEGSIALTQKRIRRLKFFFWKKAVRQQLENDLRLLLVNLPQYQHAHVNTATVKEKAHKNYLVVEKACTDHKKEHCRTIAYCEDLIRQIQSLADGDSAYKKAVEVSIQTSDYALEEASSFLSNLKLQHKALADRVDYDAYTACIAHLQEIEQQLTHLGTSSKMRQKDNALILAGTIDSSLVEITKSKLPIHHVFLDEAGYTCLAKGMAAFAGGAPVTFLGDHKQLPPICEWNNIPWESAPVALWALPVAYYPELMKGSLEDLYHRCYGKHEEPSFQGIKYRSLNTSYRFGPGLAKILAKHIYTDKFRGVNSAPFEIEIIDAPFKAGLETRTSISEANTIQCYLEANPDIDFVVLTPYRNQAKLIWKTLPKQHKHQVLTVHRSQGCEWDTVIFSIVDGVKPYFTNSRSRIGKKVINTAISRAKCKLVIVCDVASWRTHKSQMLNELIEAGRFIE